MSSAEAQLREENRVLRAELTRMESLLAAARAERDDIGMRYNNVSERVSTGPPLLKRCSHL